MMLQPTCLVLPDAAGLISGGNRPHSNLPNSSESTCEEDGLHPTQPCELLETLVNLAPVKRVDSNFELKSPFDLPTPLLLPVDALSPPVARVGSRRSQRRAQPLGSPDFVRLSPLEAKSPTSLKRHPVVHGRQLMQLDKLPEARGYNDFPGPMPFPASPCPLPDSSGNGLLSMMYSEHPPLSLWPSETLNDDVFDTCRPVACLPRPSLSPPPNCSPTTILSDRDDAFASPSLGPMTSPMPPISTQLSLMTVDINFLSSPSQDESSLLPSWPSPKAMAGFNQAFSGTSSWSADRKTPATTPLTPRKPFRTSPFFSLPFDDGHGPLFSNTSDVKDRDRSPLQPTAEFVMWTPSPPPNFTGRPRFLSPQRRTGVRCALTSMFSHVRVVSPPFHSPSSCNSDPPPSDLSIDDAEDAQDAEDTEDFEYVENVQDVEDVENVVPPPDNTSLTPSPYRPRKRRGSDAEFSGRSYKHA